MHPDTLFEVPAASIPVAGLDARFPVRRIYCVGQNYRAHAVEMGGDPQREPPFFFIKPSDCIVTGNADVHYPPRTADLHHEIELVVAIGVGGSNIREAEAVRHIYGYAVGIDLTRRDLQAEAKKKGRPWDTGKGFEQAAPVSPIHVMADTIVPRSGRIWLESNGELRQQGDIGDLIWSIPETIAELSTYFSLAPGDLIFTGTPAGVGPVVVGDTLRGGIDGIDEIECRIVD